MKWINSRRFIICVCCISIIAYIVVWEREAYIQVAGFLIPVLVAFMGATTIDRFSDNYHKSKNKDEEE